jgi:hypothetical protein
MASFAVSKHARKFEGGFSLMEPGRQIIKVTKVESKIKTRQYSVKITAVNANGETVNSSWKWNPTKEREDNSKPTQEDFFAWFFQKGCGLEFDDDGSCDPDDMLNHYIDVEIKHVVYEADEIETEDGEVIKRPERTYANIGKLYGPVDGFEDDDDEDDDEDEPAPKKQKKAPKKPPKKQVVEDDDDDEDDDDEPEFD